jgi:hypothetical protein
MQFAIMAQLIGSLLQNGQQQQALAMRQQAAAIYGDTALPKLDQMVAAQLPQDSIDAWKQATQASQGQGQAISALEAEVNAQGESPQDKVAFLNARNNAMGVANSAQAGIQRGLAARGMAGGGLDVASQEMAAQGAANQANSADVNEAAAADARRLQATTDLASASSTARGQDQAALSAMDSLNEFNTNNQMKAQEHNLDIPLSLFAAKMQKNAGQANALGGVASQFNTIGQTYANQGTGVGQALATYAQQPEKSQGVTGASTKAPTPSDASYWSNPGAPSSTTNPKDPVWSGFDDRWA